MPAHAARSFRPVLMAAVAVGVIGASSAGIAVARSSSGDGETRPAAATTLDATPFEAAPGPDLEELAAEPAPSASSPTASPSPTTTPASPKAKPTAKRTSTARPTSTSTRRPAASPTRTRTTTKPPATTTRPSNPDGGSSTVAEVITLVNAEREEAGCGALTGDTRLHRAAQKHSDRQADQETMSHELPGEASMGDRVTAEGYRWGGVAENVAAGYRTPAAVMDGWMNSPGHKANILNCGYKNIGVGVTKSAKGTLYWTQNFASPR